MIAQIALALPVECIHCGARATFRITCGDFVSNTCERCRPTERQLIELAALEGVEIFVQEIG